MTSTTGPAIDGLTFLSHLGSGGYSDVYLYERERPRMRVAVKVLTDTRLSAAEAAQFAAEAETMAELADHPYIVQVFSTGMTGDGRPYLVMKYYPPPNLGKKAETHRFGIAEVLRIAIQIASAVETAHRAGILHRDIKPANILISQYGEPGLTDFGIAGQAGETDDEEDLGVSIPWSPPEVLSGASNGTALSDVYSLGATTWHLLTGRSPFEVPGGDNSPRSLMGRVLKVAPPATGRADAPASLDRLLQQAMAKNPKHRHKSALDFARALQAVEQELRFPRTDIVVEDLSSHAKPVRDASPTSPDATRQRAVRPTSTSAPAPTPAPNTAFAPPTDAPRPAAAASAAPPSAPRTTQRPTRPSASSTLGAFSPPVGGAPTPAAPQRSVPSTQPPVPQPAAKSEPQTVRRAQRPITALEPDKVSPPVRKHKFRASVVAAIAAMVVVAGVVVAVVASSGGGSGSHSTPPSENSATNQGGFDNEPVDAPTVHQSYDAARKSLTFSWSVPAGQTTHGFAYWFVGSPNRISRTNDAHVSVPTSKPASYCIIVASVEPDGSLVQAPETCGAG
jgi:serine/threonine protein kinase